MDDSKYIPNNNFEVAIFITITEYCHKEYSKRGFSSLSIWGGYFRNSINNIDFSYPESASKKLTPIVREISFIFSPLSKIYALTTPEIVSFMITYLKHSLWVEYEPLLKARKGYTGNFY